MAPLALKPEDIYSAALLDFAIGTGGMDGKRKLPFEPMSKFLVPPLVAPI